MKERQVIYRHTQTGTVMIVMLAIPLLLCLSFTLAGGGAAAQVPLAVFAILMALFHSLTVEIDRQRLSWRFGVGLIGKSVPLPLISEAQAVTNPWYCGWGIRWTGQGWLYNVSGFEAVQIRLLDGRVCRIGTDEPLRLAQAIENARSG